MKVVIIGGVAGGATAAARLRRLDEQAEIVMLERSGYVSYANCGLPYYVGGVITDQEELTLQTPESFRRRFAVDVRVRHEATAIDPTRKTVTVRRLEDGSEYEEAYDKLLLSPGARPLRPALPGVESARVFTLRTVEDTLRLHTFIQSSAPRSAVVVGGGFIGLEMMENLTHQGIQVTVVEKQRQVMAPIDYDMACGVHAYLRDKGVALRLDAAVEGFEETDSSLSVRLEGGERLETDMVVLALGVVPDTGLAKEAGLTLGGRGAIVVNDRMETGSFPTVRKKPRKDLNRASNKSRLLSSILIALMCALLGFAYMSQINNTKSTYETMDESELVRLLNESNTQISNLEQRKTQLNSQLNSLKSAANEQEQARKIAKQNEETSGLISGRLPAKGQGVTIRIGRGLTTKVDASIMFNLIEELRNAGAEVIAINNVRVITSTYIQDAEEGLIVDGTTIKPTYTVKAIGNPQELSNAVDIAGGVGAQLQVKYGSNVNVQPSDSIIIDEVREATQNQYAKTVE